MKLRSGKTIGSTDTIPNSIMLLFTISKPSNVPAAQAAQATQVLVKKIKDCLTSLDLVTSENIPKRIQICHDVFRLISNNLEFIVTPEFSPSPKFITVVYKKTYELANEIFPSIEAYIAKNRPMASKIYYKMAEETYFLLLKVRQDIEKHRPELKPKYTNDYSGCDCSCCVDD